MLDEVLKDVRADYELLERSGFSAQSALDTLKSIVITYMSTGRIGYADGVHMASAVVFLLVSHRKMGGGKKNGLDSQ